MKSITLKKIRMLHCTHRSSPLAAEKHSSGLRVINSLILILNHRGLSSAEHERNYIELWDEVGARGQVIKAYHVMIFQDDTQLILLNAAHQVLKRFPSFKIFV